MSAPTRRPTRSTLLTRRGVAAGSLVSLGLIAAGTASAPAALAAPAPTGNPPAGDQAQDGRSGHAGTLNTVPDETGGNEQTAPAAYFGTGKNFSIDLQPAGPVPPDLDLSGGRFTLADASGQVAGTCVTDSAGACSVGTPSPLNFSPLFGGDTTTGSHIVVPAGNYTITQTAAPKGLAAEDGSLGQIDLCTFMDPNCGMGAALDVPDASLFTTEVVGTVVDETTQQPISGVTYHLTGPDYPHRAAEAAGDPVAPGNERAAVAASTTTSATTTAATTTSAPTTSATTTAATTTSAPTPDCTGAQAPTAAGGDPSSDAEPVYDCGTRTTDDQGQFVWDGYFLTGTWSLTGVTFPDGYETGPDVDFSADEAGASWGVNWSLTPKAADAGGSGQAGGSTSSWAPPTSSAASSGAASSSAGQQPPVVTVPATAVGSRTVNGTTPAGQAVAANPPAAPAPAIDPAAPAGGGATGGSDQAAASPSVPLGPQADGPAPARLKTESSRLQETGLIAIGILFVAVVLFAVLMVRRRARRG